MGLDEYEAMMDTLYRAQYEQYLAEFDSGSTTGGSTSTGSTTDSTQHEEDHEHEEDHDHTEEDTAAGEDDGTVEIVSGYWIQRARQPAVCSSSSYR